MALAIVSPQDGVHDPLCVDDGFFVRVSYDFSSVAAKTGTGRPAGRAVTDPDFVVKTVVDGRTQQFEIFPGDPLHGQWDSQDFAVGVGRYDIAVTAYNDTGGVFEGPVFERNIDVTQEACD